MNQIEKVARAFHALWNLVQYHKSGGHSGSGSDRTLANALRELSAIAAMPVQAEPQWYGIETAPRDGKAVLLWVPADDGWDAYVASGWYESGVFDRRWYAAMDENPLSPQPTHWMPLPTPPAGGSDEQE